MINSVSKIGEEYKIDYLYNLIVKDIVPARNLSEEVYYALDLDDENLNPYICFEDDNITIVYPHIGVVMYEYSSKNKVKCIENHLFKKLKIK